MVNKMCSCELFYWPFKRPKKASFSFPDDIDLRNRWIYFVNRKDWQPSKHSVICVDHFDEKYLKIGKQRTKLLWNLLPVPTKQVDTVSSPSILRAPVPPRPLPTVRYFGRNDMPSFLLEDKIKYLNCLREQDSPPGFTFRHQNNNILYYNLVFDEASGIPAVYECITIDEFLHVTLTYRGYHLPLPQWFRTGNDCTLHRKSMLVNFPPYMRNKGSEMNSILQEMGTTQFHKPQGRPQYSASMIRYALLIRFTSCQAYKIMLEQLPLPSLRFWPFLIRFCSFRENFKSICDFATSGGRGGTSSDTVVLEPSSYEFQTFACPLVFNTRVPSSLDVVPSSDGINTLFLLYKKPVY